MAIIWLIIGAIVGYLISHHQSVTKITEMMESHKSAIDEKDIMVADMLVNHEHIKAKVRQQESISRQKERIFEERGRICQEMAKVANQAIDLAARYVPEHEREKVRQTREKQNQVATKLVGGWYVTK